MGFLGNNNKFDISLLNQLKMLQILEIFQAGDINFTFLQQHSNLDALIISGSTSSDLASVGLLKRLQTLDVSHTAITEINWIRGLENLQDINLEGCRINSILPLLSLKNLVSLNLNDTDVEDISPLESCKRLKYLKLTGLKVSNISPLENCRELKEIRIDGAIGREQIEYLQVKLPACSVITHFKDELANRGPSHWSSIN